MLEYFYTNLMSFLELETFELNWLLLHEKNSFVLCFAEEEKNEKHDGDMIYIFVN